MYSSTATAADDAGNQDIDGEGILHEDDGTIKAMK